MATITSGGKGRTDVSSRSVPSIKDDAKFSKIKTVTEGITDLTGSNAGSSGFIITTAGSSVIWPTEGDSIEASNIGSKSPSVPLHLA